MKNIYQIGVGLFSFVMLISFNSMAQTQAFHKGSLLLSVSEGTTIGNYSTSSDDTKKHTKCKKGDRDPFVIEYGLSNRWGIGLSSGTDLFRVNPSEFYGFRTSSNIVKATTSEFTFDGNYHVFANKRLDLSVFASLGMFSVTIKGNDSDNFYNYTAKGNIVRMGTRARYYFCKRLGVFGMVSSYYGNCSPKNVTGNTVGKNYSTIISGAAIEGGFCYRLF